MSPRARCRVVGPHSLRPSPASMASSCGGAVVVIIGSMARELAPRSSSKRLEPQQLGDGGLDLRVAVAEALLLLEVSDGGRHAAA